ncbi:MAG: serine/threonine-protein phosphatase [Oscillospiraceae bacterium]|nr:serine/threonine-protein phosphatase [Oscillospiraceae bacterium]
MIGPAMMGMVENNLYLDMSNISRCKNQETLCGDFHRVFGNRERRIVVISDGLGSGVRANILATLTTTILGTMLDRKMPLEECIDTVASTLPVSKQHGLAYATFTAVEIEKNVVFIMNYDNPPVLLFRNGKATRYPYTVRFVGDKEIRESRLKVQEGDVLVMMTDGVTHSGIGKHNDNGWAVAEIQKYLEEQDVLNLSASEIGALLQKHCLELCDGVNDDDTTTTVLKFRSHTNLNMLIGPPKNKRDDRQVLNLFFRKEGIHVVSGGNTSKMVSRYLGKPVEVQMGSGNAEVPDMATIEGVDMVTEGVITLERVCDLCEKIITNPMEILWLREETDPASVLALMLLQESTDVNILFGMAANDAHDDIGIGFEKKLQLIRKLEELLSSVGKQVKITYC